MILGIFTAYITLGHEIQLHDEWDKPTKKNYLTILSVCNGIAITLANHTYQYVIQYIVYWENHKNIADHEDSLIMKNFIFYFCNSFTSIFYLAFFKHDEDVTIQHRH